MIKSKYDLIIQRLAQKPAFTAAEARKEGIPSRMLSHFCKKGIIERISRGAYKGVQSELDIDFQWEDLAITAMSIPNGVICLISALSYYRLTDEVMKEFWIAIPHSSQCPKRPNTRIFRMRNITLGKTEIRIGIHSLKFFDRERTIVDTFRLLGLETALKALKIALQLPKAEKIDLVKLQEYAKKLRVNITPYLMAMTI